MPGRKPLLALGAAGAMVGCVFWPHWYRVPLGDSGLVGEWAGQPAWSHGDTIVWRFDANGTAARSRVRKPGSGRPAAEDREALGHWRVYDDSTHTPRRFVCFDYGRQWAQLPCWYFILDAGSASGLGHRALRLMGRVGGQPQAPEIYADTHDLNK